MLGFDTKTAAGLAAGWYDGKETLKEKNDRLLRKNAKLSQKLTVVKKEFMRTRARLIQCENKLTKALHEKRVLRREIENLAEMLDEARNNAEGGYEDYTAIPAEMFNGIFEKMRGENEGASAAEKAESKDENFLPYKLEL